MEVETKMRDRRRTEWENKVKGKIVWRERREIWGKNFDHQEEREKKREERERGWMGLKMSD